MNLFLNALIGSQGGVVHNPSEPSEPTDPSTLDVVMVFDGNSITLGTYNSDNNIAQYYPNQVNANYTEFNSKEFYSYGVNGQDTVSMLADASTQIYPKATAGKTNILVAWESENSMLGGTTAQKNFDDFVTYFQGAKDAGFTHCIHVTGFYPRKNLNGTYSNPGVTQAEFDAQHDFFEMVKNASLNSVPWDAHVDLRNAPNIGGARDQFINEYFGDYIHLNTIGLDIVANEVKVKIDQLLNL